MLSNLFKTAWRNIRRHKSFTIINVGGLGFGIAVCLVIFVLIRFHTSFDNFHEKKDRIYRLLTEYHHADSKEIFYGSGISQAIPRAIKTSIPGIEEVAPIYHPGDEQFQVVDAEGRILKKFRERKGIFFTTPSFFKIFDFKLIDGDVGTALNGPDKVILSRRVANKYFGDWRNAVGKSIRWNNRDVLKVTGILADIPANTDMQLRIVGALGTGFTADMLKSTEWNGTNANFNCYLLTQPGLSNAQLTANLRALVKKNHSPDNQDSEVAQALKDVHFDGKAGNFSNMSITPQMIRMLWMIAAFILIIACVNFVNLATAQAVNRAKEVGVRKVLGGNRRQLQLQFLTETLVIVILSVTVAIGISSLGIPLIGRIMELPLSAAMLWQFTVAFFIVTLTILVTLVAGFYPSIVLAGFNPVNALKSKIAFKVSKGISLRRWLVVFQFIIAQGLIICTLIIVKQMNYFTSENMGFVKDAIVNVPFPSDSASISKLDYLKQRLHNINGIQQVSLSSNIPAGEQANWTMFTFENAAQHVDFYSIIKMVDEQYQPTYQLQLVAGKNLSASDTVKEFLVNEALIQKLGIADPKNAINKQITLGKFAKGRISGVLKNYHNRSFKDDYAPLLLTTYKPGYELCNIKLSMLNATQALKGIEKVWTEVYPDYAFEYKFLDEQIAGFYKQESQLAGIYKCFAVIAIFLSCLGLYGLASFMAVQRIKEVGIRKVLGASVNGIVYLFSKEFVWMILIGFAIAAPVTWYLMNKWLQGYVYRIRIGWSDFLLAVIIALLIALITIISQLLKVALVNPVKTLRSE
ncbi:ABC transporter permease [Mucilaginibacter litoreus]|uniref:ABC transporter permease n=1 Tax=Mucilaginibacter litoreus TaxID=1048221 RepID=A0ABW3AQ23_9SPHI